MMLDHVILFPTPPNRGDFQHGLAYRRGNWYTPTCRECGGGLESSEGGYSSEAREGLCITANKSALEQVQLRLGLFKYYATVG
jgi:hypothetical protein